MNIKRYIISNCHCFNTSSALLRGSLLESAVFENNLAEAKGKLTIKGITNPLSFTVTKNGNTYTASIAVDRSKFDVRYGSGSFFENLGDKVIADIFTLDVVLVVE